MNPDDRDDPLKHSRFKRMPKLWRLGQNAPRAVDPLGDEYRVNIFLTNTQADRAEKEAVQTGLGDLQAWCQAALRNLINHLDDTDEPHTISHFPSIYQRPASSASEITAELDIPEDPAFIREWAGIVENPTQLPALNAPTVEIEYVINDPDAIPEEPLTWADGQLEPLVEKVIAPLRSGTAPAESDVATLSRLLGSYADDLTPLDSLPRPLVRTLYRLAMESQVLISEVHPQLGLDLSVITLVRKIQAAVGKILDS